MLHINVPRSTTYVFELSTTANCVSPRALMGSVCRVAITNCSEIDANNSQNKRINKLCNEMYFFFFGGGAKLGREYSANVPHVLIIVL